MNDFIFQNTTRVYFGRDQLKNLGEELKKYGQRVLLVYGGSIKKIGLYDKVLKEIASAGLKCFERYGFCCKRIADYNRSHACGDRLRNGLRRRDLESADA